VDAHFGPDDVRAMSPRRTSEDIDKMGKEAREEMRRYVGTNFLAHVSEPIIACGSEMTWLTYSLP
jgi:hypothetical protein